MDPMSALAIVAAVFQLVDLGSRLVSKGVTRYKGTRVDSDEVQTLQKEVKALSANIRRMCEGSDDDRMAALLGECEVLVEDLQKMFDKTHPSSAGAGRSPHAIKLKLDSMKSMTSETIVFSLWEKTKASETREVMFGTQMTDLLSAIKDIGRAVEQRKTTNADNDSELVGSDLGATSPWPGPEQAGATGPFRDLIRSGQAPSFTEIEDYIRNSVTNSDIPSTLANLLWHRSWKMADSEMAQSVANATHGNLKDAAAAAAARYHFTESAARQTAVSDSIVQTYAWIYDLSRLAPQGQPAWSSFPEWLEGKKEPIYWITGKPGSGKSTMMKHILQSPLLNDHLRKWADRRPLLWVSYYAWNAGTTLQKSLNGMKRTLLEQALIKFPHIVPKLSPRMWAFSVTLQHPTAIKLSDYAPGLLDWELEESFNALLSLTETEISLAIFIDGLDEFDIKPLEVVSLVESLTSPSRRLKICVASRPWVEFDDAYREVPKLRMDLNTSTDMAVFVTERFRACRAFGELRALRPKEATELLRDVTEKGNGVFIWLRLVVDELVESATEGCGIGALQIVVESLPSDIASLYQALWKRTPDRNRKRGAVLFQLSCTEFWPLSSVEAWLVDDYALSGCGVQQELPAELLSSKPAARPVREHLKPSLTRKLAAGTRGLLEVTDSGKVDFTHRTAHEWIRQATTQKQISELVCDLELNIRLVFVELLTLQVSCPALCFGSEQNIAIRTLYCASTVSVRSEEESQRLVGALDAFDIRFGKMLQEAVKRRRGLVLHNVPPMPHWSSYSRLGYQGISNGVPLDVTEKTSDFINLAAQFYILPYITKKAAKNASILRRVSPHHLGIFESAVLGYESFWGGHRMRLEQPATSYPFVPVNQRIDTIRYLLEQGLGQSKAFLPWGQPSIYLNVLRYIDDSLEPQATQRKDYYAAVLRLLTSDIAKRDGAKETWRSAKRWFKNRISI